ncbi:speckle-type POZ protein-like [Aphidius gifuensis]|uniref:speckle-type POZ protein-like n=1 Tax=Aphidius gifuensis TaxID=684658 RepID=UPI001CDBB2D5|nr:speckle-type POZ protein-like [Aphidius gifuensis]
MSVISRPTQDSVKLLMSNRDYVTGIETCEFTYEWTIKNFSPWTSGKIISPSFSSNYSDFDDEWILEINPNKATDSDNESEFDSHCSCKPESDDCKTDTHCCSAKSDDSKSVDRYVSVELELESFNPFNSLLQLQAKCEILMNNRKVETKECKFGKKSFRAIKCILGARSPVFAAMFEHEEFKKNETNEVVIEDIDEDVFEEFLHYIYTGETSNVAKMPMKLLVAADKYQVACLKKICEESICETINLDNVASVLEHLLLS